MHMAHDSKQYQAFDLNLLALFDALMQERSVTRAARRVGLSQSAMSHGLARLRRALHDPLLVRSGRTMVPTGRARQLAGGVSAAFTQLRAALGADGGVRPAELAMQLRIMTTEYGELAALGGFVARLNREAPGVVVVVQRAPKLFDVPRAELEDGEIDYALGFFDQPVPGSRLQSSSLLTDRWVCIVRRGDRSRLSLKSFLERSQIRIIYGVEGMTLTTDGGLIGRALRRAGLRRSIAVVVPHFLTVPFLVAKTGLIGIVPQRVAIALRPAVRFDMHKLPIAIPPAELRLVWHERLESDPAHRWLRQALEAVCRSGDRFAP
jgi:DNA-binding transcriptional LysR family regulator